MAELSPPEGKENQLHEGNWMLARIQDLDLSKVGERSIVYHPELRKAVVLNPMGSWLWSQLDSPMDQEQLEHKLQERFPEVPGDRIKTDVEAFVQHLLSEGVLKRLD